MRKQFWLITGAVLLGALGVLAACGGGSGSSSSAGTTTTGASGVITGFGSVFVGGHEYATNAATQILDGDNDDAAAASAALQVGMLAEVDADSSGSTATLLRFTSAVRGEIDAIDASGASMTVLGQNVVITGGTSFSGTTSAGGTVTQLSDLQTGNYVVVYGYVECITSSCTSGGTQIVATLVTEPASAGRYRAQGYVSNSSTGSFTLNGLTVDIATTGSTLTTCNVAGCALADGDFVVVRSATAPTGTYANPGSTLTITATDIKRRQDAPTFASGTTVMVEGPVSQLTGTAFVVRGLTVDASASNLATVLASLANGQVVEVTGTIAATGSLVASAITVEQHATMMLTAPMDSATTTSITVLGQVFTVNSETRFMDWASDVRPFNSTNFSTVLAAGDQLVVSGYTNSSGNVATRVERIRTPSSPTVAIEGVVSADTTGSTAGTVTIAGVTASLSSTTQVFYLGAGSTPTLSGFFAAITPGTTVAAVAGTPGSSTGTITAGSAMVMSPATRWAMGH